MIYFFKTVNIKPYLVKIGFTRNRDLSQRKKGLQTSCPDDLEFIGKLEGGKIKEREIHSLFKKFHKKGEWFLYDKSMVDFIKNDKQKYSIFSKKTEPESLHEQPLKKDAGLGIGTDYISRTYRKQTFCGNIYLIVVPRNDDKDKIECIRIIGSGKNDCGASFYESKADDLTFMIRRIRNQHEANAIIKNQRFHRCNKYLPNKDKIQSCSDAIGQVLEKEIEEHAGRQ